MNPDVGTSGTAVFVQVMAQTQPSVQSIADAVDRNKSTVHAHLKHLRRLGLVTWEDGKQGTLRATCEVVSNCSELLFGRGNLRAENQVLPATACDGPGSLADTPIEEVADSGQ